MVTKQTVVEETVKHMFPWMHAVEPGIGHQGLKHKATKAAVDVAMNVIPHVPDKTLLSLLNNSIERIPYEVGREFSREMVMAVKRLLASPLYDDSTRTLIRRIVDCQYDVIARRENFRQTYHFEPPKFIAISPSMRCNLRCVGCYAGEYSKKDDMTSETLTRVIKEVKEIGMSFVTVIGGEPFISEDVIQMMESNPDMFFIVFTNGTLIDEAMAKRIKKMGTVYPCISLEGFETETEARRGKGTYAKILRAMDNLRNVGAPFGFSATAIRSNNELVSSPEFVDFYIEKGCVAGWYFNYIPIGRNPDLDLMPTPEQRIARFNRLRELRKTKPILLADFWCDGTIVQGCLAGGKDYLHINNKGDVEPCVFVHFAVDNVQNKSMVDILQSDFFKKLRSRQPFSDNLLRPCMIIDNPDVLRDAVVTSGAYPTHQGAETIVNDLARPMDKYAAEYKKVADPEWRKIVSANTGER